MRQDLQLPQLAALREFSGYDARKENLSEGDEAESRGDQVG